MLLEYCKHNLSNDANISRLNSSIELCLWQWQPQLKQLHKWISRKTIATMMNCLQCTLHTNLWYKCLFQLMQQKSSLKFLSNAGKFIVQCSMKSLQSCDIIIFSFPNTRQMEKDKSSPQRTLSASALHCGCSLVSMLYSLIFQTLPFKNGLLKTCFIFLKEFVYISHNFFSILFFVRFFSFTLMDFPLILKASIFSQRKTFLNKQYWIHIQFYYQFRRIDFFVSRRRMCVEIIEWNNL